MTDAYYVRFSNAFDILNKNPNCIPLRIEFLEKSENVEEIEILKSVAFKKNDSLSNLICFFRKFIKNEKATSGYIFMLKNNQSEFIMPRLSDKLGDLYSEYYSPDMNLVVYVQRENIFG